MSISGRLRPIADSELELILSWRNAPTVRANMYTRHEISVAEHLAWWERTHQREDQRYFMYEDLSTPLGVVGFTMIDRINSNCSWAFYASPDAPRGTGSRMEFLALEQAFSAMGLHKLYCEVLAFNEPVIRLHRKFGFRIEGAFSEQHLKDGSYIDIVRLGILSREWLGRRDEMRTGLTGSQQER